MESHVQAADSHLIDGLSFKLRPTAEYIMDRRQATFFSTGATTYSPNTTRVLKFNLVDAASWLDPSSLKIQLTVVNSDDTAGNLLRPIVTSPASMFTRMRIMAGGSLIEDITEHDRLYQMLASFQPTGKQFNDQIEGWGVEAAVTGDEYAQNNYPQPTIAGASAKKVVCFSPMAGILMQDKYLPLRFMNGLQIELEMGQLAAWCNVSGANTSTKFHLENCKVLCDLVRLDPELDNSYAAHVLSGRSLPVHCSGWFCTTQSVPNSKDFSVNLSRGFSRLKTAFISMFREHASNSATIKEVNYFYWPAVGEPELQLSVGSKKYPEYPVTASCEFWSRLKTSLGIHASSHSLNITPAQYGALTGVGGDKFVAALDLEKSLGAGFTGQSTKAGDLMTVAWKGVGVNTGSFAQKIYICLQYDQIINVRDSGVEVLE